jgi:hypothetical protein
VTRCQGVSLHSSGCAVSVPLVCRSHAALSMWVREDLSDQGLPIIGVTPSVSEALPCVGSALSSTNFEKRGSCLFVAGPECSLLRVKRTSR